MMKHGIDDIDAMSLDDARQEILKPVTPELLLLAFEAIADMDENAPLEDMLNAILRHTGAVRHSTAIQCAIRIQALEHSLKNSPVTSGHLTRNTNGTIQEISSELAEVISSITVKRLDNGLYIFENEYSIWEWVQSPKNIAGRA